MAYRSASYAEDTFEAVDADDCDLSSWELLNPSDDDADDNCSYGEEETDDDGDYHVDPPVENLVTVEITWPDILIKSSSLTDVDVDHDVAEEDSDGEDYIDDDDYVDDGVDDELVPYWVSDRLDRGRMRKLGKRACTKMNKAKRLPFYCNRPGCVQMFK